MTEARHPHDARSPVATRPLTVAMVLSVTLNAFEALAVIAIMPTITEDLGGEGLYGAAVAVYMLANLVSTVVMGDLADRHGAARPFGLALVLFAAGLVVSGTATNMAVLVLGRCLQGFGGGGLATVDYVVIGRAYPSERRPKVFAILSTAWVVPGLIAPSVAAGVAEVASWRLVFLGLLPLVGALAVLALPAMARVGAEPDAHIEPGRTIAAVRLSVGTALVVGGLAARSPLVLVPAVGAGLWVAVPPFLRLMPAGVLRAAPGLPAGVACRALSFMAFFGADTYIPFAIDRVHGSGTFLAGVSITTGTLTWTVGSYLQARDDGRRGARRIVMSGFAIIGLGIALTLPIAWGTTPVALAFVAWAVAGLGMGLAFNATSVVAIDHATAGREGAVGAQISMMDSLGFALATGVGGALIALAERHGDRFTPALVTQFGLALLAALAGIRAARRVADR